MPGQPRNSRRPWIGLRTTPWLGAFSLALLALSMPRVAASPAPASPASSQAAFHEIARVLRHPRCINCHTHTDFPRQGDEGRPHAMRVRRGPDNHGVAGMECGSCHQSSNQAEGGIPGAPGWALAPLSMGWERLDDHQLAESLKDRASNGGRDLEGLYHHFVDDPLVGWAWEPGADRQPPPISRQELAQLVRTWIDGGAVSPPAKEAP